MGQGAGRPRAGHPCWPLSYVTRPPGGCRALAAAGAALVLAAAAAPAAHAAGVAGNGRLGFYTLDSRQLAERMGLSVNVANGNLLLEADDMDVTGTGLDLSVTRAYNSRSPAAGAVGFGWTMFPSEDVALRTPAGGGADLEFDGPGGYALRFTHNADGSFTTPPGIDATLCSTAVAGCAAGGSFGLTFNSSGLRWAFTNGVVTQIR